MGDDGKKKKIFILGGAFILVVAVVGTVAATLSVRHSASPAAPVEPSASAKSIQAICQPTDYQDTCVNALTSIAGNTSDPKQLMHAALQVIANHARQAMNQSETLKELAQDKSTSDSIENCKELLDYAIDDLNNSIDRLNGIDITSMNMAVDDLMTWLGAVLTYQETCLDGFDNATTPAALKTRQVLNMTRQLTTNALAIVDEASGILGQFDLSSLSRRLLSEVDAKPDWMSTSGRMLFSLADDQITPNAVVAQDGSGQFTTISDAVMAAPDRSRRPYIIYIKAGIYKEQVKIPVKKSNIVMIGDGPTQTKVTGSQNYIDGVQTFKTATFFVAGPSFMAKNMGFENSAGAAKHQAVALLVQSDKAVFYNCQIDGYQDTLYTHTNRQFYRDCTISGTIDFIFGNAAAYFQNCLIIVRKPLDNQQNIVAAQGRTQNRERSAIIIHNCTVTADPEYEPFKDKLPSYLGRPWKDYSRTFFMQSDLGDLIHPDGWLPWDGTMYLNTLFYSEFDNRGPGADTSRRVKWRGIKTLDFARASAKFTTETYFKGRAWLPQTGVPYIPGLLPMSEAGRIH